MKYDAIILLGGKGTRVNKFTKKIPKCLIPINDKPFLYYQLKFFNKNNIKNIILSTGYMSDQVKRYVKSNINFVNLKIIDDGKKPLGTGGAVLNALKFLKKNFFMIYGDSYLTVNLNKIKINKKKSTMFIFKNNNKFDRSNVEKTNSKSIIYHDKLKNKKLRYIDYGISYLRNDIFDKKKKNTKFDLSTLLSDISKKNMLEGHEVKKRFFEIGSYKGIKELKNYLKK